MHDAAESAHVAAQVTWRQASDAVGSAPPYKRMPAAASKTPDVLLLPRCAGVKCPAANVFGPEEGSEDVYNGSGCRDVVGAVLGGCNGEWMECAAYPASYPASVETQQGRKCSAAMQCLAQHCSAGDDSRHPAASTTP